MMLTVRYAGLTDPGRIRHQNEDNWMADPEQGLFIVADGLGGESAGGLASKIVVATLPGLVCQQFGKMKTLPRRATAKRLMARAIVSLSEQLRKQTKDEPNLAGMGSTVVCALVRGSNVLLAHMGDSRAYRLRGQRLRQLTKDHSVTQMLVDSGEITPEDVAAHPARGRLTRAVGMEGEPLPQSRLLAFRPGDVLLLCTDGLTGMLTDRHLEAILTDDQPLETRCQHLVDAANQAGGKDNITALLVSFDTGAPASPTGGSHAEPTLKACSSPQGVSENRTLLRS